MRLRAWASDRPGRPPHALRHPSTGLGSRSEFVWGLTRNKGVFFGWGMTNRKGGREPKSASSSHISCSASLSRLRHPSFAQRTHSLLFVRAVGLSALPCANGRRRLRPNRSSSWVSATIARRWVPCAAPSTWRGARGGAGSRGPKRTAHLRRTAQIEPFLAPPRSPPPQPGMAAAVFFWICVCLWPCPFLCRGRIGAGKQHAPERGALAVVPSCR